MRAVQTSADPLNEAAFFFDKTAWLASEILSLTVRMASSAADLDAGRMARNLKHMSAALDQLKKFHDQAALLNDSMQRAIDTEQKRQGVKA